MARITQADVEAIGKAVPDPTPTEMALMAILRALLAKHPVELSDVVASLGEMAHLRPDNTPKEKKKAAALKVAHMLLGKATAQAGDEA